MICIEGLEHKPDVWQQKVYQQPGPRCTQSRPNKGFILTLLKVQKCVCKRIKPSSSNILVYCVIIRTLTFHCLLCHIIFYVTKKNTGFIEIIRYILNVNHTLIYSILQDIRKCSHKTGRFQRVLHLLSPDTRNLINEIVLMRGCTEYSHSWDKHHRQTGNSFNSFWSKSFSIYSHRLGKYTKEALGEDCIFYGLKDFFISQIFRHTENEFWAKAPRPSCVKAYLFLDQDKADQILSKAILEPFAVAMLWELGAPEQTADKRDQDRLSQIMGEWDRLGEAAKHYKQ